MTDLFVFVFLISKKISVDASISIYIVVDRLQEFHQGHAQRDARTSEQARDAVVEEPLQVGRVHGGRAEIHDY